MRASLTVNNMAMPPGLIFRRAILKSFSTTFNVIYLQIRQRNDPAIPIDCARWCMFNRDHRVSPRSLSSGGALRRPVGGGPGILRVEGGAFGAALDAMIGGWIAAYDSLQLILSGMIGSRQGWVEAPYARCPAGADDLVEALVRLDDDTLRIFLVPGLSTE